MKRRLVQLLAVAWRLACVGLLLAWAVSLLRVDLWWIDTASTRSVVTHGGGKTRLAWARLDYTPQQWRTENGLPNPTPPTGLSVQYERGTTDDLDFDWHSYAHPWSHVWPRTSFTDNPAEFFSESPPMPTTSWGVELPHLTLALPLAGLWLAIAIRNRRRQRRLSGHCTACGYDLRATPDRCPECGHAPAEAAS